MDENPRPQCNQYLLQRGISRRRQTRVKAVYRCRSTDALRSRRTLQNRQVGDRSLLRALDGQKLHARFIDRTPDQPARPHGTAAIEGQNQIVGQARGIWDFDTCAGIGQIVHDTVDH